MDILDLMVRLNTGEIELTPKNRIVFEWELMKEINRLIEEWNEMWFRIIQEKKLEVNK